MNTPPTEFETASILQRFVAQGIDVIFFLALAALPAQFLTSNSGFVAIALVLVLMVSALAYRFFADGVFGGAALGKRLLGIYVVDATTRQPCSIGQSLARMSVFVIPFVFLIEPVLLAIDSRQRWGDRLAQTYVLRRHPKPAPVPAPSRPFDLSKIGDTLAKLKTPTDDA